MKKMMGILGMAVVIFVVAAAAFFLGRYSGSGKQEKIPAGQIKQEKESEDKNPGAQIKEKPADATAAPAPVTMRAKGENEGKITYTVSASWGDEKTTYTQLDAVIANQADQETAGWEVALTVPEDSRVNQSWNGKMKLKGTELKILPMDYNAVIPAGETETFGLILETPSAFVPEKSELVLQ